MTTVVLGWDALDPERVEAFGLSGTFGRHYREIETYNNPALGKPHTYEVWPSMITGLGRDEHGIRAVSEDSGAEWSNPWLNFASSLAQYTIPERLKSAVGRVLRERGATLAMKTPSYYEDRDHWTVFDGRESLALAIPNYHTAINDELGIVFDRGAQLADFVNIEVGEDGGSRHVPAVSLRRLEQRLYGEAAKKAGIVQAAVRQDYDLIWVWFGFLDSVGHIEPTVDDVDWVERAYRQAAVWTQAIHDTASADDTIVCVSDHGLQAGSHTEAAFIGATDAEAIQGVDSVLDVASAVGSVTPSNDLSGPSMDGHPEADSVRQNLEELGYL